MGFSGFSSTVSSHTYKGKLFLKVSSYEFIKFVTLRMSESSC